MAELLRGVPVAAAMTEDLRRRCEALVRTGIRPTLAVVRLGAREDDLSYERGIEKRAEKVGFTVRKEVLEERTSQDELLELIANLNADPSVHGVLLFRPLPSLRKG